MEERRSAAKSPPSGAYLCQESAPCRQGGHMKRATVIYPAATQRSVRFQSNATRTATEAWSGIMIIPSPDPEPASE
jgi:hypothetical protein